MAGGGGPILVKSFWAESCVPAPRNNKSNVFFIVLFNKPIVAAESRLVKHTRINHGANDGLMWMNCVFQWKMEEMENGKVNSGALRVLRVVDE